MKKRSFALPLACSAAAMILLASCFIAGQSASRTRFGGAAKFVDGISAQVLNDPPSAFWTVHSRVVRFTPIVVNKDYDYINYTKVRIKRNGSDIRKQDCGTTPQGGECRIDNHQTWSSLSGCYFYMNSQAQRKTKLNNQIFPSYSTSNWDVLKPGPACPNQE